MPAASANRITLWRGSTTGVCLILLSSFPAATTLPEKVAAPTTNPKKPEISAVRPRCPAPRTNSTKETRNEASPPAPFCMATRDGIRIMFTRSATSQPSTVPSTATGSNTLRSVKWWR
ncbi:MAG: hypothetical protein BWY79_01403 [Actinobacteria bacterium ADurb.Bin444]|nr:MAG: hypothetical protein BWY79_01403 [Actinobacteria bacterium ADurb.Bin444]